MKTFRFAFWPSVVVIVVVGSASVVGSSVEPVVDVDTIVEVIEAEVEVVVEVVVKVVVEVVVEVLVVDSNSISGSTLAMDLALQYFSKSTRAPILTGSFSELFFSILIGRK